MLKKGFYTTLFCGLAVISCLAQKEGSKERYRQYKSSNQDMASILLKEAYDLKAEDPGQALAKVEEALGISIARKDDYNEGRCYNLIGEINQGIQEWKLANDNFKTAHTKLKQQYSGTAEFLKILKGLGNTYQMLNQYPLAIQYYEAALVLSNKIRVGESNDIILAIAEVQYQEGSYNEALKTLKRVSYGKSYDHELMSGIQNLEAKILSKRNELSSSSQAFDSSISNFIPRSNNAAKQVQSIKETKEEISGALRSQQRYNDDVQLRNKSIVFNNNIRDLEEVANDKVAISKSLSDLGDTRAAVKELEDAVKISDTINNPEARAQAYLALADIYEKYGAREKALRAYKRYSEAIGVTKKRDELQRIQRDDLLKKQREIESLSREVLLSQEQEKVEQTIVSRQKLVIYGLVFIIVVVATTSYFMYKSAVASKLANQLLALKSLRSQMNPHFIFNALNSVNHFIAKQDERTANKFLSEFSQLMRLVLENSQEDFIPLNTEQEILSLYLKLEHYRFGDKFDYEIDLDDTPDPEVIDMPPMLLQPYIENAIWHGLRYRETKGNLLLKFGKEGDKLTVEIRDDGIGRKRSAELKTANQKKHTSTGLRNIQERLNILSKVYKKNYTVDIVDLPQNQGTLVKLFLPINHSKNRTT